MALIYIAAALLVCSVVWMILLAIVVDHHD